MQSESGSEHLMSPTGLHQRDIGKRGVIIEEKEGEPPKDVLILYNPNEVSQRRASLNDLSNSLRRILIVLYRPHHNLHHSLIMRVRRVELVNGMAHVPDGQVIVITSYRVRLVMKSIHEESPGPTPWEREEEVSMLLPVYHLPSKIPEIAPAAEVVSRSIN